MAVKKKIELINSRNKPVITVKHSPVYVHFTIIHAKASGFILMNLWEENGTQIGPMIYIQQYERFCLFTLVNVGVSFHGYDIQSPRDLLLYYLALIFLTTHSSRVAATNDIKNLK